ncbi:segregation/condensation protein A [Methylocella sp. CPCC 101449]|nr:ScpA family protein [Methylocella sp. CPCC 101449]MDT2021595.1 segregation/condensation protein A [Methylocella sp. CPCC 101449]HEV2571685.1 ScpA family protein [Beijerinckiaceae bacterium]
MADLPFEDSVQLDKGDTEPSFLVDVDGFEGPLDLLLELARRQKVDLAKISVLALAEQYLEFIDEARKVRLELAADYLVMAAWLAYLKSRLLLPEQPKGEEPAAADLAAALAYRLKRLEAIRDAAEKLVNRPRLGRDLFTRGSPEGVTILKTSEFQANLYDLLSAYARQRQKHVLSRVTLKQRVVWSLAEAREALERLAGRAIDWTSMDSYLGQYFTTPETRRTVRASTFSASLELVREGKLELRQERAFAPIWVRASNHDPLAPKLSVVEN